MTRPPSDDDSDLVGFVYDARFDAELEAIEPDAMSADRITHSLEFALSRNPRLGWPVEGTPYYLFPVYDRKGKEYVVYYRIRERVEVLSIAPSGEETFLP